MKRETGVKKKLSKLLELSFEGITQLKGKKYEKFDNDPEKRLSMMDIYHSIEKNSYSLPEIIRNEISEILGKD